MQPPFRFLLPSLCLLAAVAGVRPAPAQTPPPPGIAPAAPLSLAATAPLDPWLTSPAFWQTTPEHFPEGRALGFRWVSDAHDALRTASPRLRLRDLPVAEVIARFSPASAAVPTGTPGVAPAPATLAATGGKLQLSGVQVSIYNRGDAGDLEPKRFDDLVEQSKTTLNALAGVKPVERGVDNTSAVQSKGLVWVTPASRYLLEWSATPENKVQGIAYRAEFVRLKITPVRDQPKTVLDQMRAASAPATAASHGTTVRAAELPARVLKEADGAVRLPNVPMVNQGDKGYCATAATERVLRYYGADVDQSELAQAANTSTEGGTSGAEMLAALKKLASKFKVNLVTLYDMTFPDFTRAVDDYNRVARAAPKNLGVTLIDTRAQPFSPELAYSQMNGEILRDARTKLNPAYVTKFERDIQGRIDRGIPLMWGVHLGLLPEEGLPREARGGHLRLIIGYNARTKEIYYTDTWGRGHELKKMPLANAWTITEGLYALEPS